MLTAEELRNIMWLLITAALVMLMQAGFCCLESGLARAKNSINVAIKNLFDFCISSLVFWLFGFALMFGASWHGLMGTTGFMPDGGHGAWGLAFFLFQLVFCGTATTIVSGAVAERMRFAAYLVVAFLVSGFTYPIFGHWAWGGAAEGTAAGWLAHKGFIDFAGSTVVHSVGGWVALAAVLVIGPRIGRFDPDKPPMQPQNLPLAMLGVFLLWFGWFGFNGGSTLAMNAQVPLILVNTNLAAAAGGASALAMSWATLRRPDVTMTMNGVLAGLVGITASCHVTTPLAAVLIGIVAGLVMMAGCALLERLKVDDVVGAVPVHAFCGVWGTLAVALLGNEQAFGGRTRYEQLLIQADGVAGCWLWAFVGSYARLRVINRVMSLRATAEDELLGLNVSEHAAGTELSELLSAMHRQQERANFTEPVAVEPHTEVGQIALQYNRVLERVNEEMLSREQVVEALRQAEAKYRGIYENAVHGIFQTTPDGRYLSANPALARIYGYDSPDHLIRSIGQIDRQLYVDPRRRADFIAEMGTYGEIADFESQVYRADGSVIWISERARAVRNDVGGMEYYEGTVVDISERKRSEALAHEKDAAEAANRAKSQFLANMSHELRTPLNGVIGMLNLLGETTLSPQQSRYASIARSSADLLLNVINQILDFSKIEAGMLELESLDFDLRALVEETLEMLASKAQEKGLELVLDVPAELPSAVRGDPHRLRQVVVNLLSNAIKFTEGGQVVLRAAIEKETSEACTLRVAVEDTGIGIPPAAQARLFHSFSQVDASTTRQFGGTGLGLAICKQIVEHMRGEIGVDSQVGQGSVFWFRVTLAKAVTAQPALRATPPELEGMRILAVDDNGTNRELLFRQLSAWRFRVETAHNGRAALDLMRRAAAEGRPVEMAIIDGHMPEMDGFELAREIVTDEMLRGTPLLMLTSVSTPLADDDVTRLGIAGCLTKPVRQSQLFDTIVTVAAPRQSRRSAPAREKKPSDVKNRHGADEGAVAGPPRARLLLAEDNEINQSVALEILQRAGFACDVAATGRAAIDRLLSYPYDAVLMDCQMPELDGPTAAQEIRRLEQSGSLAERGYRVPIIAVTANAVEGDREMCLASGMDGYLTKPIDAAQLIEILDAMVLSVDRTEPDVAPFDLSALARRCLDNQDFVTRILAKFAERLPADLARMEQAIGDNRLDEAGTLAHTLKGSAANLSAARLQRLAGELEAACRAEDVARAGIA